MSVETGEHIETLPQLLPFSQHIGVVLLPVLVVICLTFETSLVPHDLFWQVVFSTFLH